MIDFGHTDSQTEEGNFNNFHGTDTGFGAVSTLDLIDSNGAETGITFAVVPGGGGSWANEGAFYDGPYPDAVANQPTSALRDSMFIRSPAVADFTLSGLDPNALYDVLMFGSRLNTGGPNSEWTFTDNVGEVEFAFDALSNDSEVAFFEGLVPDENGSLLLTYTTSNDGTRPRGAMNFMQITVSGGGEVDSLEITSVVLERGDVTPTNVVSWTSSADASYSLSYSEDLENWIEVDDGIESDGELTVFPHVLDPFYTNLIDAPVLFYQVELVE